MKKYLILALFLCIFALKTFAVEIVYPKTNPVKINANSTFFIGSANPKQKLTVNGKEIEVSQSGAFAQIVPLCGGVNKFKIISGDEVLNFEIDKAQQQTTHIKSNPLIEYPPIMFCVKKDNAPLRMTPVDGGINRLSHLPCGVKVKIDGEKGDFYRVYLNSTVWGWIAKRDVEQVSDSNENANLKGTKIKDNDDFLTYEFEFDKKAPFVLKETEKGLSLQIFNLANQLDSTYQSDIPIAKLFGYDIGYDNNKLIFKIRKFPKISPEKPLQNIIIAIDAGHGGNEHGAIGCCGDMEKDINLAIAKELKAQLEKRGAKIVMTRENDIDLSLADRVKIAKDKNAAISISIHANALPDGADPLKNRGTSVYYYHNQAKSLADNILNSMTSQLGTQNDKVRQGSLALVRPTSSVSVLIEVAYMINPDDYELLTDVNFQANCAKAITDGIEKYLLN